MILAEVVDTKGDNSSMWHDRKGDGKASMTTARESVLDKRFEIEGEIGDHLLMENAIRECVERGL